MTKLEEKIREIAGDMAFEYSALDWMPLTQDVKDRKAEIESALTAVDEMGIEQIASSLD